jgi:hypothetical protein
MVALQIASNGIVAKRLAFVSQSENGDLQQVAAAENSP